ncbi:MAG: lysylphosphatidylglycerol synthase domain-containing protein [Gemmatimonadaceae bacterium]
MTRRFGSWPVIVLPLLLGAMGAAWWVYAVGGDVLWRDIARARGLWVIAALGVTAAWLLARFIRWQFLLRRVGVRLPIRSTLGTYIAGLAGTATPAYVGEAVRGIFIKRRFGVPMRLSLAVLVLERLYDALSLVLILGVVAAMAGDAGTLRVALLFLALVIAAVAVLWPVGRRVGLRAEAMMALRRPQVVLPALVISLAGWGVSATLTWISANALGAAIPMGAGMRIFGLSTLFGAATLLPAGVGVAGGVAIVELGNLALPVAKAVAIVALWRITSTGFALSLGAIFLWREVRNSTGGEARPAEGTAHFDHIAEQYNAQWSPHVWDLLLDRKLGFMTEALPPAPEAGTGLDLGCGLGLQAASLRKRGYTVVGLDPSVGLLAVGQRRLGASPVIAGSALQLPFADNSLGFVYTIGVLHHLPGREAQRTALAEIARVLKPGGLFLVHESNPRNPMFRFYMGYLFPILKSIDEGTEWWIDPRTWDDVADLTVREVEYFTFLPDFTPRFLMRPAVAFERLLERGPTRPWSAHYMAVLQKRSREA